MIGLLLTLLRQYLSSLGWYAGLMFTWQFGQQRVPSMNDGQHCATILQIGQQRVLSVSMDDVKDSGIA